MTLLQQNRGGSDLINGGDMQIKSRPGSEENTLSLIERLYLSRGLKSDECTTELSELVSYHSLLNIDKAAQLLAKAIQEQQKIIVIGDFDADGATATALAVSALKSMGSENVHFLVPNRFEFGYGLTVGIVELASQLNPNLIITVDNGISNIDGVCKARSLGIDVLITDHHLPGEVLPDANVIINPNQPDDLFPSKSIAGVGVIFYVMTALRKELQTLGWFEQRTMPNMGYFLDLVALGTIADVVSLDKNNRILVKHGLKRIQSGQARPGINALLTVCGKNAPQLKASDLGFSLGPRLNAAGRLDDMSLGISCLLEENYLTAVAKARQLDQLNQERREIESQMQHEAMAIIQTVYGEIDKQAELPDGLCLYRDTWHQGVIGIIAGRLKDKFHRPCIIFAEASETEIKASARSVEGLNIRDVLAAIDVKHPGLIKKFGGHAMAAGLSIATDDFKRFQSIFENEVKTYSLEKKKTIWTDGPLNEADYNLQTVQQLIDAGPWGQGFPEPIFDNIFKIIDQRLVGQKHLKLCLQPLASSSMIDAIAFNVDIEQWPSHRSKYLRAVYQMERNEFQGRVRLQLLILFMQPITMEQLQEAEVQES